MRSRAPAERAGRTFDIPAESRAVDRRPLYECVVTHYAAVNATIEQLDELDRLTNDLPGTQPAVYTQFLIACAAFTAAKPPGRGTGGRIRLR